MSLTYGLIIALILSLTTTLWALWKLKQLTLKLTTLESLAKPPPKDSPPLVLCASCKGIRDDNNQWQALESYLNAEYDTPVSHSICPACMNSLYSDLPQSHTEKA